MNCSCPIEWVVHLVNLCHGTWIVNMFSKIFLNVVKLPLVPKYFLFNNMNTTACLLLYIYPIVFVFIILNSVIFSLEFQFSITTADKKVIHMT